MCLSMVFTSFAVPTKFSIKWHSQCMDANIALIKSYLWLVKVMPKYAKLDTNIGRIFASGEVMMMEFVILYTCAYAFKMWILYGACSSNSEFVI